MKKSFTVLAIILTILSCADTSENIMIVTGNIDGLKKGVVYLQKVQDSAVVSVDSLEIRGDGSFAFEEEIESPEIFYLYLEKADNNDINDRITFFGEKGTITINTVWNQFESEAKIKGSKNHELFEEYKKMLSNFNKRDLELAQIALAVGDSINTDSIEQLAEHNYISRFRYLLNFGLTNPTSHVTPYMALTDGVEANPIYLDSIYNKLPDSIANGKYGKALKAFIDKN